MLVQRQDGKGAKGFNFYKLRALPGLRPGEKIPPLPPLAAVNESYADAKNEKVPLHEDVKTANANEAYQRPNEKCDLYNNGKAQNYSNKDSLKIG